MKSEAARKVNELIVLLDECAKRDTEFAADAAMRVVYGIKYSSSDIKKLDLLEAGDEA